MEFLGLCRIALRNKMIYMVLNKTQEVNFHFSILIVHAFSEK